MESFRALFATFTGVAGDKNSRETFNLQRSKGTTRICSTETFRLQLPAFSFLFCFSSISLLFQLLMVAFDILFFFFLAKRRHCKIALRRGNEDLKMCECVGKF